MMRIKKWIYLQFSSEPYKLRDLVIDHLYFYCFEELLPVVTNEHNEKHTGNYDEKFGKVIRRTYETREILQGKILVNRKLINSYFAEKLDLMNIDRRKSFEMKLTEAQNYLLGASYISKHPEDTEEFYFTTKGKLHYEEGRSFEDQFVNRRNSNIAIVISILALFFSIFF